MPTSNNTVYRSFADQGLHYFTRGHAIAPQDTVKSPAAWRGKDLRENAGDWLVPLGDSEIAELSAAADALIEAAVPMGEITRDGFVLPTLGAKLLAWRHEINTGRGFVVLRGLPVDAWGEQKSSYVFWGIGHYLGVPGAQNTSEELLGHVRDYGGAGEELVRQYRTTENIDFHCDAADAVGLLCLKTAKMGGQSRIVSSVTVYNRLRQEYPVLAARLFQPFALDRRNEVAQGEVPWLAIQPCCYGDDGVLRTFYHSAYFRSAERHSNVSLDDISRETLDVFDRLCADPDMHLDMWLQPGDLQFISNHTIVHARTEYQDWPEPERKRHLLRLWLSIEL